MCIIFRSIHVPEPLYPSITLVYPNLPSTSKTSFSVLNVDAKEFIPFSTSNSDYATRYLIDNENSSLGAAMATCFILATFIIKYLMFAGSTS